jgi:hypothetical protein
MRGCLWVYSGLSRHQVFERPRHLPNLIALWTTWERAGFQQKLQPRAGHMVDIEDYPVKRWHQDDLATTALDGACSVSALERITDPRRRSLCGPMNAKLTKAA